VSNGFFSIQGRQVATPAANSQTVGPFNIPFSPTASVFSGSLGAGTTTDPVPAGSFGCVIIPPIGNPPGGVTLKMKTVSGDSGTFISTQQPTEIQWDTVNGEVPADLYLVVAGGSIEVVVQFT
jgi:hypothetical protein